MRARGDPRFVLLAPALLAGGCSALHVPAEPLAAPTDQPVTTSAERLDASRDAGAATGSEMAGTSAAIDSGALPTAAESTAAAEVQVIDEPIYFPGARARPQGSAVEVSREDEIVATWNRGGMASALADGAHAKVPHPAPRVKVDVTEIRGNASQADVQRAARLKSYWPFRLCYEQGLRRMQKLHGTIKLRLTIGSNGRPSWVEQLATELGDAAVVNCVVQSVMKLGLPAPEAGTPQVTLDVSLWPGDEPVSVKTGLGGGPSAPADAATLAEVLRSRRSEVRRCYAAGLRRHDRLWGRLALELRIAGNSIVDANEVESHFPDPEVTTCVRQAFLRAELPSEGRELVIVYPLRLGQPPSAKSAPR